MKKQNKQSQKAYLDIIIRDANGKVIYKDTQEKKDVLEGQIESRMIMESIKGKTDNEILVYLTETKIFVPLEEDYYKD